MYGLFSIPIIQVIRTMKNREEIYKELMSKLLSFSYREDMPSLLRDSRDIMGVYFNTLDKSPFSDFKYKQLWYAIQENIKHDNKVWFYRYWEFADQYYGLVYDFEESKHKERFREFHIAVGGLLALYGKMEWIEHIAWFTNVLPPSYFLVPNTFTQIMNWLIHFSELVDDPNIMENRFHLYAQYEGVRAGANLYMGIVKYLALMMCRLPKVNYNVVYDNPMAIPTAYGNTQEQRNDYITVNQRNITLARNFEKVLLKLQLQHHDDARKKAVSLIEEYILTCESMLKCQNQVDEDKIIHIKETLLSEFDRQRKNHITSDVSNLTAYKKVSWFSVSQDVLENRDFLQGEFYNNINRESVMIGIIMQDAYRKYADIFKTIDAAYTYTIRFSDLKLALDRLSFTDEYVCLVSGIGYQSLPKGFHDKVNVHDIFTRQSEILLIKKEKLPFVSFDEINSSDQNFKLINAECNKILYSNIDEIYKDEYKAVEKPIFVLKTGCNISICIPSADMPFVRIKAVDSITQDTFDLENVVAIAKLNL